jgi:cytochrome P450
MSQAHEPARPAIPEGYPAGPIAAVTHPNPYPYYEDLLARAPLAYDDALGLWVAASAEAVTAVLTSPLCRVRPPAEPVPRTLLGSPAAEIFRQLVRMNDGPRHGELRQAAAPALGALDADRAAGPSRDWARRLTAEMGGPPAPLQVTELAFRLPSYVIGDLLGVPGHRLPRLAARMSDFVAALAPGSSAEQVERGKETAGLLLDLFRTGGEPGAAVANRIGFLMQAHDATAGLIGNTLLALAARPELRRQAASPTGLREILQHVLRFDPPVQNTRRFVAEDSVVAGHPMRAGDAVLVVLAAANRDPASRHLFTFGIGPHACPGEALATTIAKAGVESLLAAGVDLEGLAKQFIYRPLANARIPLFGETPG